MFCPNCGTENSSAYRFCASCGEDLSKYAAGQSSAPAQDDAGPPPPEAAPVPPTSPSPPPGEATPPLPPVAPSTTPLRPGAPVPLPTPSPRPSASGTVPGGRAVPSAPGQATGGGATRGLGLKPVPIALAVIMLLLLGFGAYHMTRRPTTSPPPASSPVATATTSSPSVSPPVTTPTSGEVTPPAEATPVRLVDVVLCKAFSPIRQAPVQATTTFQPSDTFRAAVRLEGVRKGMRVTGTWAGPGYSRGTTYTANRNGSPVVRYVERAPGGGWTTGPYTFTVSVDDTRVKEVDFEVVGAGGTASPPPASSPSPTPATSASPSPAGRGPAADRVVNAVMCKSVDNQNRPASPTSVFGPSEQFLCSVQLANVSSGQRVTTRWYQGERKLTQIHLRLKHSGSGFVKFMLPPRGSWEAGTYRLEVLLDGVLGQTLTFEVR